MLRRDQILIDRLACLMILTSRRLSAQNSLIHRDTEQETRTSLDFFLFARKQQEEETADVHIIVIVMMKGRQKEDRKVVTAKKLKWKGDWERR